jgi:hypothetical protein
MKITIQGQDYTAALDASRSLTIERKLNAPSVCNLALNLSANAGLAIPQRNQSVAVAGDDGTIYFTGYLAATPMPEYTGMALEGPRYIYALEAVSDELLLDQSGTAPSALTGGDTAGALVTAMITRTGLTSLSTAELNLGTLVSNSVTNPGARFSRSAGQVANDARASYRALGAALSLSSIPVTVHALNETNGSLTLADLALTANASRALANDITVCGEHEPTAYVTEYFSGDGVTTEFDLSQAPYLVPASKSVLIRELFNEGSINLNVWNYPHEDIVLGDDGLVIDGGNGIDGECVLSAVNRVEMGGTLLLEAIGVTLANGSTGVLPGFFLGTETQAACIAGFQVTAAQGSGAVTVQPLAQGATVGSGYAINPANQYTLRIRVHCAEIERDLSFYRSWGDSGEIAYGGQHDLLPALVQFELQEFVNGVAGMPVVLYDGAITSLPDTCFVLAVSAINLVGTIRALNLTNLGSGWVVSTPSNGTQFTRRLGTTAESAECHLESTGKLVFYAGYTPPAAEQIAVSYRAVGRAVGRSVDAASQQALTQAGLPSVSAWKGSVTSPAARSSQDCRNAAQTMVSAAAGVSALWSGTYKGTRVSFASDVWPGDALELNAPSLNLNTQMIVRSVKVSYRASYPDLVQYAISFANDWANDLAIKTSETVPEDAWLPATINPTYLPNLSTLTVTAMSGNTVTVNAGATPPASGGFEVRRRDYAFMPGEDPDLAMRGPEPNMTITRLSVSDRFFIRMFDAATPPNYSEFSAALIINLPLGS